MGASAAEMSRVHDLAVDITKRIPGTTETDVTAAYSQVRNIFARNPEEAFKILPNLMGFQQVKRNNNPEMSAEQSQKLAYETIRAADLTGQMTDVGAFTHKRSYSSR